MPVRLFVGNLPYDATESELKEYFSPVGQLTYVYFPTDRETGQKRGFAFVEFGERSQAEEAIRRFNNQQFKGRPLAVNEARAKEIRPPGSAPRAPFVRPGGPPRPHSGGGSHSPGMARGPARSEYGADSTSMETPRRPRNRKFGTDAKRKGEQSRKLGSEWGKKKPIPERTRGQLFSMDEEEDRLALQEEQDLEPDFEEYEDYEEENEKE